MKVAIRDAAARLWRALAFGTTVAGLCGLSACATTEKYERSLDQMRGLSEAELLQAQGKPAQVFESGGYRYLVYVRRHRALLPGQALGHDLTGRGSSIDHMAVGGNPDLAVEVGCKTTFELQSGRVIAWANQGNYCKAGD